MKETIYTIQVNDAVNGSPGCPICRMENSLEQKYVERAVGAAMMEPYDLQRTTRVGFCANHYQKMLETDKKLPLALMLESHTAEIISMLEEGDSKQGPKKTTEKMDALAHSCAICEQIDTTMVQYYRTLFDLWKNDEGFQKRLLSGDGFCITHFSKLLTLCASYCNKKETHAFRGRVIAYQKQALEGLFDDISHFCKKFDYRNTDMPWGNAKDAPNRGAKKLS